MFLMEHFPDERRIHMQDLTQEDMRIYIHDRLRFIRSSDDFEDIFKSMYQKADGIFLWMTLVTKRLNDLHDNGASWGRLKEELDHTPQDLSKLFAHIIQSLDPSDRKRAYQTFAMMRKAKEYDSRLPLFSYPFIDYYTGDPDSCDYKHWRAENMSQSDRIVQARKMLTGYCGGLAEVGTGSHEDPTISFIHRSVPEFLDAMRTKDMERCLRGFCAEDALSQLLLAYLWARDTSECKNYPDGHYKSLSLQSYRITKMRKEANIGKAPFIFEEQLELALARLGVRSITEQDNYRWICLMDGGIRHRVVATFYRRPEPKLYYICSPYLLAACLGDFAYVLWKVTHDPLVTCSPLQTILLFYCILHSDPKEYSRTVHRILDILLEKGLSTETPTTLAPGTLLNIDNVEVTVWQHLIIHILISPNHLTIFSPSILWKWALENKADPHFVIRIPREEIQGPYTHRTTLFLGKDKRRLDGVPMKIKFSSLIKSRKCPDTEGTGIGMTLIDIINEGNFADREALIALVERNTRLLQIEPENTEDHTDKGCPKIVPEEDSTEQIRDSSTMLPAIEMEMESIAQEDSTEQMSNSSTMLRASVPDKESIARKQSSYEAKTPLIVVYLLGKWVVFCDITSISEILQALYLL